MAAGVTFSSSLRWGVRPQPVSWRIANNGTRGGGGDGETHPPPPVLVPVPGEFRFPASVLPPPKGQGKALPDMPGFGWERCCKVQTPSALTSKGSGEKELLGHLPLENLLPEAVGD